MARIVRRSILSLILALLAGQVPAFASQDCINRKAQPNLRRHIEKLAKAETGQEIVRSTFSYCDLGGYEAAVVATTWRPQTDGTRLRDLVSCQRESRKTRNPWKCTKEPEREMDVAIPGRAGQLVAQVDVDLTAEFATRLAWRAFEVAPGIQSTEPCKDFQSGRQQAELVKQAFADPGNAMIFVNQLNERLLVGREYTMIVFKRNPDDPTRFELYCWYTYEEL